MKIIREYKDNSYKLIFGEPEMFMEFLNNFIPIDILKNIKPDDIEDISERFIPLFSENKDSDTVKRVNIKGNAPFFIICIVEHESEVNYRSSFKMLQYISLTLNEYEKEVNKEHKNISFTKGFKYPPVLPVVFYDGNEKWTAELNFVNKTEMSEIFYNYIPKFEYILVKLQEYSIRDLVKYGDTLSLIMIFDKIKTADGIKVLKELPPDYIDRLNQNVPDSLKKLISDVVTLFLTKINIPKDEIDVITEKIGQRRFQEMFGIADYDVQATRFEAKKEGKIEGKIEDTVNIIIDLQIPVGRAMRITKLPEQERDNVIAELKRQNIVYTL
jgi:hypothetical protein